VSAEEVVEAGTLAEHGPISSVSIHRMLVDGVVAAPGGAHFTACLPEYGRDEAFPAGLREERGRTRVLGSLPESLRRR